jgi:hypothetical protein
LGPAPRFRLNIPNEQDFNEDMIELFFQNMLDNPDIPERQDEVNVVQRTDGNPVRTNNDNRNRIPPRQLDNKNVKGNDVVEKREKEGDHVAFINHANTKKK